jgi:hypothetical protein
MQLFNDAFLVSRLFSFDVRVINECGAICGIELAEETEVF